MGPDASVQADVFSPRGTFRSNTEYLYSYNKLCAREYFSFTFHCRGISDKVSREFAEKLVSFVQTHEAHHLPHRSSNGFAPFVLCFRRASSTVNDLIAATSQRSRNGKPLHCCSVNQLEFGEHGKRPDEVFDAFFFDGVFH